MTVERRVLIVAIVVTFCAFLDGAAINVALPAIERELGGGLTTQQWVVDGYLITLGALILIAGSLSDSFGRVRILRVGPIGFGVTPLLCAVAPTDAFLIWSCVLQGAAAALLVPSSLALIIATFPTERQGRAIGSWTAWTTSAFVVGPLLGGILVDLSSWRLIFAINVVPIAVVLRLLHGLTADTPPLVRSRLDWVGTALSIVGIGAPVYALIEQARFGWSSPAVCLPLIIGTLCLSAFLWWEHRTPAPMMPLALFRRRNFEMGKLATAFIYAGFAFGPFAITIFVQEFGGYSALAAGAALLPSMVMLILLASSFGGVSSRFGPRLFMTLGPPICAAGFLLTILVTERGRILDEAVPRDRGLRAGHGDHGRAAHRGDSRGRRSRAGGHRLGHQQRGRPPRWPRGDRLHRDHRRLTAQPRRVPPGGGGHRGDAGDRRGCLLPRHPQSGAGDDPSQWPRFVKLTGSSTYGAQTARSSSLIRSGRPVAAVTMTRVVAARVNRTRGLTPTGEYSS